MIGIERLPVLVDLAFGIDGMYAGVKETTEEGVVIPQYFPANSLRLVKPLDYPVKVPKDAIVGPLEPSSVEAKGRPKRVVTITNTVSGRTPYLDQLDIQMNERMNQLRQQIEEEKWKRKDEQRRRMESEDEQEQEKRKSEQRGGGNRRQAPPFDRDPSSNW